MRDSLAREVWERRGVRGQFLWFIFLPVSFLFRLGVQWRNKFFDWGWLKSTRLPRPVISVGNLTVGGTGKTPTCLWLARELQQRGFRVGILSRGYRRHERSTVVLQAESAKASGSEKENEALQAGDEPLMMARLYGQNLGVGKDRSEAAARLLQSTDIDVFLMDDGFQHRWVKRDIDLLLLGSESSGWLLPVGPFREPRKNLRRADFLLDTAASGQWRRIVPKKMRSASYAAQLRPVSLVGFNSHKLKEHSLSLLYRSKILTVTGVADPKGLYQLIHECDGEIVNTLEFPDHHLYTTADWQEINRVGRLVDLIITTEKDILKLQRFPFAKDKLLALRVAMNVENGAALMDAIVQRLSSSDRAVAAGS
jgi:tetraacyldisaccharide 4'-kinase